ncbi:hypothetical protein MTsN2n4_41850 [Pseudoalteromonas sp. MTN2-4]
MFLDVFVFLYLIFCVLIWKFDLSSKKRFWDIFEWVQIFGVIIAVGFSGSFFLSGEFVKFLISLPFVLYLERKFRKFKDTQY